MKFMIFYEHIVIENLEVDFACYFECCSINLSTSISPLF
jgi:hypothetical protein